MKEMENLSNSERQLEQVQEELARTRLENEQEKRDLERKLKESTLSGGSGQSSTSSDDDLKSSSLLGSPSSLIDQNRMLKLTELEHELYSTKAELARLRHVATSGGRWTPSVELQRLLQYTHEVEQKAIQTKRETIAASMRSAKEEVGFIISKPSVSEKKFLFLPVRTSSEEE